MKKTKFSWMCFLFITLSLSGAAALSAQPIYSDDELVEMGHESYYRNDYTRAAMYLYAYIQRDPPLMSDPDHAGQVQEALAYSLGSRVAGTKGDDGSGTSGKPIPKPKLNKPKKTSVAPVALEQPGYTIVCRGGGNLYFDYTPYSNFSQSPQIWILFQRGAQKVGSNWENMGALMPGQCSWLDRTVSNNEPDRIIVTNVRNFSITWTKGQVTGISSSLSYLYALQDPNRYQSFRVYNDRKGNFIVKSIGPSR